MKISCISYTHQQHEFLDLPSKDEIDMIIHAGDFSDSKKSLHKFLTWYSNLPYKYKILVAGNHDEVIAKMGYELVYELCESIGIIYLQDSSVEIEGVKFHGSPWSPTFYNWAFMAEEDELNEYWQLIPLNTEVLITHGPAYGKGDLVNNNWHKDPHVGSKTLLKRLDDLENLKLHFYGHIHEAFGVHEEEGQKFVSYNASSLHYYQLELNKPLVFGI